MVLESILDLKTLNVHFVEKKEKFFWNSNRTQILSQAKAFLLDCPCYYRVLKLSLPSRQNKNLSIHVVTFTLISNLATDHIQKRTGQALLFSFEYNLLPNLISK